MKSIKVPVPPKKVGWIDSVPAWMHAAGIKKGEVGYLSRQQLESQMRPGAGHTLPSQIWACGMLMAPKNHGELAMVWRRDRATDKMRCAPATPGDFAQALIKAAFEYYTPAISTDDEKRLLRAKLAEQYSRESIRRALATIEESGCCERRRADGKPLRELSADALRRLPSGNIRIYFFAQPRAAEIEQVQADFSALQLTSDTDTSQDDPYNHYVRTECLPQICIPQILKVLKVDLYKFFAFHSLPETPAEQRKLEKSAAAKLASTLAKPEYQESLLAAIETAQMSLVVKVREVLAMDATGENQAPAAPPDVGTTCLPEVGTEGVPDVGTTRRQIHVNESVNRVVNAKSSSSSSTDPGGPTTTPPDSFPHQTPFHEAHVAVWQAAGKSDVPTEKQSAQAEAALNGRSEEFLRWLAPKLGRLRHPGVLPSTVKEFMQTKPTPPPPEPAKCWNCEGSLEGGSSDGLCWPCNERRAVLKAAGVAV